MVARLWSRAIGWRCSLSSRTITGDFYRFFDATPHAEFLYACVRKTIEDDLPRETKFLVLYDRFRGHIDDIVDMPDRTVDLLFHFLRQNGGRLSKRAREQEFARLTDGEVTAVEEAYRASFAEDVAHP